MKTLGFKLKVARQKAGYKQIDAAKKLGISNGTLSGYERDYRDPDTTTLKKMAKLYNVSVDDLLGNERQINENKSEYNALTEKNEKDIGKRVEKMRKDLEQGNADGEGLSFMGEPMSEEAIESVLASLEFLERQATISNKKYIPKKYRDK